MPAAQTLPAAAPALHAELEQFLYREARLLDEARFDEWLALFADDATYWVPLEANQKDPLEACSHIYDDRTLLETRVRQYQHPRAHSRVPLARTVHQVSNVTIAAEDPARREVLVRSTLVLIEFRSERQRTFGALVEHRLRRASDDWRIAAKRVDLVNSEGELDGLAILF
jgi:3-phenylpropionate/cinnamic acid dioxygenase small subunit